VGGPDVRVVGAHPLLCLLHVLQIHQQQMKAEPRKERGGHKAQPLSCSRY
jgi:hypothetical protein